MMARRKRRETFGALRKLPSGRYQASYVGPDGVRHNAPQTFDNMTDARGWLATQQTKILTEDWSPSEVRAVEQARQRRAETFADYAEAWISTRTNRHGEHLRPRTAEEYRRLVKGPLASFAESRLSAISTEGVRTWYSALIAAGTKTQAARAYELLKSILATAVADGRIKTNPCQIRGAASASTGKKTTPPTAAELQKMIDAMPERFRAAIVIAAWTGVRFGELTELRRKDIEVITAGDAKSVVVNVSRGVTQVTGQGFVVGKTKSEAGIRSIVLPPHVNTAVLTHLKAHVGRFPESLLFPAADGVTHLSQSTFHRSWEKARAAAKRPDLPWHGLRHYGATRAAIAGATLKELQARLGHSTVAAAMRYQHTAGRDEELARRMSELA